MSPGDPQRRVDLVCFDVDGTLIKHPEDKVIWQVLNRRFLGDDSVNMDRFARYRSGEITYAEWVALDVGEWQRLGVTREQVVDAVGELRLVTGMIHCLNHAISPTIRWASAQVVTTALSAGSSTQTAKPSTGDQAIAHLSISSR